MATFSTGPVGWFDQYQQATATRLGGTLTGGSWAGYTLPWGLQAGTIAAKAPTPVVAPVVTPVTPTFEPKLEANALYGKPMALSALGFARIGASPAPIVGPYINGGVVDFIVSFGVPADPAGSRKIYAIYLDNEIAWSSVGGGTVPGDGTFSSETFDFVFKPGTRTQTVCSLETSHFAGDECAYRPQMILQITGLPIARFMSNTGKPVPYVACDIGDVTAGAIPLDGLNVGEAYERVAYSPWAGYTADTFVSEGITDQTMGILIKDNFTVVQLGQNLTSAKPNIILLQSDKLRLFDDGANVTPAFVLDRDSIIEYNGIMRAEASKEPRELELITIDPDQDYTIVPSLSKRPRVPAVVSAAVGKDSISLPLIMDAETRQVTVVFAHYYKENARKRVAFRTTMHGYEIEPGDLVGLRDIADGIDDEIFRVTETSHNGDWSVDIAAEAILRCSVFQPSDPYIGSVVLLLHCNGSAGSTTFIDSSSYANTVSANGSAQISASARFGTGALMCDGTGLDCIQSTVATLNSIALSPTNTSPYTIELFAYFNVVNVNQFLIAIDTGAFGRYFRLWQVSNDGLQFIWEDAGGVYDPLNQIDAPAGTIAPLTWYHIAVDKDSTGKIRIYVDGAMVASDTPLNSQIGVVGSNPVTVGGRTVFNNPFNGLIDDVRITRGVSRYGDLYGDASFSPPSEQFQDP